MWKPRETSLLGSRGLLGTKFEHQGRKWDCSGLEVWYVCRSLVMVHLAQRMRRVPRSQQKQDFIPVINSYLPPFRPVALIINKYKRTPRPICLA